jgi:hypothetical protein
MVQEMQEMADITISKVAEALAGALIIAVCVIFRPLLRPWYSRWGATTVEVTMELPGDEHITHRRGGYTQAISIRAQAGSVWPWLVQVGQDKGGFYSYELLENMVGCDIHNTDRIVPAYQDIKVGDMLMMHPKAPSVHVSIVEAGKALVYGGKIDEHTANVWTFFLQEESGVTRLISRWGFDYRPGLANRVAYNWLLEPIAAVMQRKMLLVIRKRAEGIYY